MAHQGSDRPTRVYYDAYNGVYRDKYGRTYYSSEQRHDSRRRHPNYNRHNYNRHSRRSRRQHKDYERDYQGCPPPFQAHPQRLRGQRSHRKRTKPELPLWSGDRRENRHLETRPPTAGMKTFDALLPKPRKVSSDIGSMPLSNREIMLANIAIELRLAILQELASHQATHRAGRRNLRASVRWQRVLSRCADSFILNMILRAATGSPRADDD